MELNIVNEAIRRDFYRIIKLLENNHKIEEVLDGNNNYYIKINTGHKTNICYNYLDKEKGFKDIEQLKIIQKKIKK